MFLYLHLIRSWNHSISWNHSVCWWFQFVSRGQIVLCKSEVCWWNWSRKAANLIIFADDVCHHWQKWYSYFILCLAISNWQLGHARTRSSIGRFCLGHIGLLAVMLLNGERLSINYFCKPVPALDPSVPLVYIGHYPPLCLVSTLGLTLLCGGVLWYCHIRNRDLYSIVVLRWWDSVLSS